MDGVIAHVVDSGPSATPRFFQIAVGAHDLYLRGVGLWRLPRAGGAPVEIAAPSGNWENVVANDVGAVASAYDGTISTVYRVDGAAPVDLAAPVGTQHHVAMWLALDGSNLVMRVSTFYASAPPDSYAVMPLEGGASSSVYQLPASLSFEWDAVVDSSLWVVERTGNDAQASFAIARAPLAGGRATVAPLQIAPVLSTAAFGGRLYLSTSSGPQNADTAVVSIGPDGDVRTEATAPASSVIQGAGLAVNASGIYLGDGKRLLRLDGSGVVPALTPSDGFQIDAVAFSQDGATIYWSESRATCTQTTTVSVEGQQEEMCQSYDRESYVRGQATNSP